MFEKHLTWEIEAYLEGTLSDSDRQRLETHLKTCPDCQNRLNETKKLQITLGRGLKEILGDPDPPPALYRQVAQKLSSPKTPASIKNRQAWSRWFWPSLGQTLNFMATLLVISLLVFGVLAMMRNQRQTALEQANQNQPQNLAAPVQIPGPTPTASPDSNTVGRTASPTPVETQDLTETSPAQATETPEIETPSQTPKSDAVLVSPDASRTARPEIVATTIIPGPTPTRIAPTNTSAQGSASTPRPNRMSTQPEATANTGPVDPRGTIAFSFFNPAPHRQVYEIHFINPDGTNHRLFSLDGVSEPALSPDGDQMAYRVWSEPTGPRSLLSSDLQGQNRHQIGGFWEDAQPDWSPQGDRLIFASQRESDRRWRLYTSQSDGSDEIDLHRQGHSPTFAPDGQRFAYVGCDQSGNQCGLWQASLADQAATASILLADPLAQAPDWSLQTDQIVYMANLNGNWDLYLLDLGLNPDERVPQRLTSDPAIEGLPVWSPDGQWIAFLSNRGGNWGIWILHPETGETHLVFAFDGGIFTPPVREPYGERSWRDEQLSWAGE